MEENFAQKRRKHPLVCFGWEAECDKIRKRKGIKNGLNDRPESYFLSGLDGLNFKGMSIQWCLLLAAHQTIRGAFKNASTRASSRLIIPASLEMRPWHELDLKASQVIAVCSSGRNPLPTARNFQFYMNTNVFPGAKSRGLHLRILKTPPQIRIKSAGLVLSVIF